jgi:hypothetical protein
MVSADARELLVTLEASAGVPGPVLSIPVGRPLKTVLRLGTTRKENLNTEDLRLLT